MSNILLRAAVGCPVSKTYVEDVFSAYTYNGTGDHKNISNGIVYDTTQEWFSLKGSAGNICALAVDDTGNIYAFSYISGGSSSVAKFSSTGSKTWERALTNTYLSDMKLDADGYIWVAGGCFHTNQYSYVIKLDPSDGTTLLQRRDTTYILGATTIQIDASSNLYLTSSGTYYYISAQKLNSSGVAQWFTQFMDSTDTYTFTFVASSLDSSGNFICGGCADYTGNPYPLLVKLAADGTDTWMTRDNAMVGRIASIVTDTDDNIYAISTHTGSLLKFNSSGVLQWEKSLVGNNSYVYFTANASIYNGLQIDPDTNDLYAILTGSTMGRIIAKYNSSGEVQWGVIFPGQMVYTEPAIVFKNGLLYCAMGQDIVVMDTDGNISGVATTIAAKIAMSNSTLTEAHFDIVALDLFDTISHSATTWAADTCTTNSAGSQTYTSAIQPAVTKCVDEAMIWMKCLDVTWDHALYSTISGARNELRLITNNMYSNADGLTSFNAVGFSIFNDSYVNSSTHFYMAWTFAKADKFFFVDSAIKAAGSDKTVDLSSLGAVGMVVVKRTDTGDWFLWHRSLTAGNLLYLNLTDVEAALGHITVSGTNLTLEDGVIANGTYIVYAWAHDTETDGLIQCGTFTTDAGALASVTLGWEPQYLILKNCEQGYNWTVFNEIRGWIPRASLDKIIYANTTAVERQADNYGSPTTTGFNIKGMEASNKFVYMAIRRGPMKSPTIGTQVCQPIVYTGTNADNRLVTTNIVTDLVIAKERNDTAGSWWADRKRGDYFLTGTSTASEEVDADSYMTPSVVSTVLYGTALSSMLGFGVGNDATRKLNIDTTASNHIAWAFRRYPNVFDIVYYTGTGSATTVVHNLGVTPELIIVKQVDGTAYDWAVYAGDATDYLILNTTAATADDSTWWNDTSPTTTVFSVGTSNSTNKSTIPYIAYLFSTLAGISKVGTYVGNGASQTINCGFSTGARWVLIKSTSTTGNWIVGDSARGIVAGDDPYLLLDSTNAEVTNKDWLDPDNSGFIVNETTGPNANTDTVTYIYLAFA
jgi:hypothetical protein